MTKINYTKDRDEFQLNFERETFVNPLKSMIDKAESGRNRGIKLSKYIYFNLDSRKLLLHIKEQMSENGKICNPICENMQKDYAAFEGWAITLKAWLYTAIDTVELKWDIPPKDMDMLQNMHYNRFLYRVIRFEEKFDWFSIDFSNQTEIEDFINNKWKNLTLNVSATIPNKKSNDENAVEYEIADKANTSIRKLFIDKYDLCLFNHQLHVGVKSQKSLLFPGGQSAIDLWGVSNSKETLCVFELKYINKQKKNKNIKVGIISELFLYVCIMEDLIKGAISVQNPIIEDEKELYRLIHSHKIKKIDAFMLSNEFHPLVYSKSVLDLLNNAKVKDNGIPIAFKTISYSYIRESYDFTIKEEQ